MSEKVLSQVSRPIREQYQKGIAALERQNFDYAIAIFTQALEQEPAFYDCREALRATQARKTGKGGGLFKKVFSGASSSPLVAKGQLVLRTNPKEALNVAEQILNGDANSSAGHKILAEAAQAMELPKTALLSLQILNRNSPKDIDIARDLAKVYADVGQGDKAEAIYMELIRQHPTNMSLNDELKDISARKTLVEGGYEAMVESGGSFRDALKSREESIALEQENRQVKTDDVAQNLINEYEARLINEPANTKLIRSLAELYTQKKNFDRALQYYGKIADLGQSDSALEKTIADINVKKFDYALSQLDPQTPDYQEQSAQLNAQRTAFVLEECKQRSDKYPNDLQIRFELGVLYFNAGKIGEAIQEFQKAQNNPHRRVASMGYLGQCFSRRNMNDLAARKLQDALKEKLIFDEEKKELVYALGNIFDKMGKKEEAIEQFKQIYEVDIGYKDVSAKVDAYYSGQG